MYQMTLFFKKVIYKNNNYLINTHQRYQIAQFFSNYLGVACPQILSKGHGFTIMWLCAAYCFDTCKFTFLDPLSNSVYSPDLYMYKILN